MTAVRDKLRLRRFRQADVRLEVKERWLPSATALSGW